MKCCLDKQVPSSFNFLFKLCKVATSEEAIPKSLMLSTVPAPCDTFTTATRKCKVLFLSKHIAHPIPPLSACSNIHLAPLMSQLSFAIYFSPQLTFLMSYSNLLQ